ncbi:MAG: Asp-tRNA(Asn)/Glu-tRNA(Gln) amidotransferase subunit GatC [Peptoniphilaceae bacterium]
MKPSEVMHIANIAQIDFTKEELEGFETSFIETMNLIDKIKEIDTKYLGITFQVNDTVNNLRPDTEGKSLKQEEAVQNSSDEKYGYFKIVKFVD